MTTVEYDERHWYGHGGWKTLCAGILRVADGPLEALLPHFPIKETDIEPLVADFVGNLVRAMVVRQQGGGSSMWGYGISLCGESALLVALIGHDPILTGRPTDRAVAPRAAFKKLLRRFLERARQRQTVKSEKSVHRQQVWEMMDAVSLEIVDEGVVDGRVVDRMSDDHIREVQRRCREKYPDNHNVNVTFARFREYFDWFCPEVTLEYDPEHPGDLADIYASLIRDTEVAPSVHVCLERLHSANAELWEAYLVKLEMHPSIPVSALAYAKKIGVTRYQLDKRFENAAIMVRDCVERSSKLWLGVRP